MRIGITGATGLISSALTEHFRRRGDEVRLFSRRAMPGGIRWDPMHGKVEPAMFEGLDAVVNLVGESLSSGRWTRRKKDLFRASRVGVTAILAETLARLANPPRVLLSGSAVGYYGDRGDEVLDETTGPGSDFLAELGASWEAAAEPARRAGIRVAHTRMGIVLTRAGGALKELQLAVKWGRVSRFGSGRQWISWIDMEDVAGGTVAVLEDDTAAGAINFVSPEPVRNADLMTALGDALKAHPFVPAPAWALRLALGEMADAALLSSTRVTPARLSALNYQFKSPTLEASLRRLFP